MTSGYLTASDPAVMEQMQDYQAYTKEKTSWKRAENYEEQLAQYGLRSASRICHSVHLIFLNIAPGSGLTLCRGTFTFCATKYRIDKISRQL